MSTVDLSQLVPGQKGIVAGLSASALPYRRKLLALGVTPGCEIQVIRQAPLGDPIEIALRGFRLCLRKAEAAAVSVEMA